MDILYLGETLLDIITESVCQVDFDNRCTTVPKISLHPGGDALNGAIDAAVIGNSVAYIGRIGSDMAGEFVLSTCRRFKIDVRQVIRSASLHTKMNILVDPNGNRSFFFFLGAASEFTLSDIDFSILRGFKILQLSSTFHLPRFDGNQGAVPLLKEAKRTGVLTSMDVTNDPSGKWGTILAPCYPYLDFFLPSEDQARELAGTNNPEKMAEFFLDHGVKYVIIKLGDRGCFCRSAHTAFYCGCYKVPVAETTGAGDAFVAGFLSGVLRGFCLEECVRLATAASAHVIQSVGANSGIRNFTTLHAFISSQNLEFQYLL